MTASENVSASAATNAAYSPRLCPANMAGESPPSSIHTRHMATSEMSIKGCVFVVIASSSCVPLCASCHISFCIIEEASSKVSLTADNFENSLIMPTD